MKPTTAVAALLVALITGPLLVPAAEAGDRRYRDGHRADRVASHVVIDKRRHHGMHRVHGKRRHDRRGHWLGRGHGYGRAHGRWHSRWRGRGNVRHHQRKYRHRGHRRSSWYGYGVSFELDGIRYHFGERHRR